MVKSTDKYIKLTVLYVCWEEKKQNDFLAFINTFSFHGQLDSWEEESINAYFDKRC